MREQHLKKLQETAAALDAIADNLDRVHMGAGAAIYTQTAKLHALVRELQDEKDALEYRRLIKPENN